MTTTLITGAAGFIGFHLARTLLQNHQRVIGLDNLNDYYDVSLKQARLSILEKEANFSFYRQDIAESAPLLSLFKKEKPDCVVNLAAQAGVRYSIQNPYAYLNSNLAGFLSALEACRHQQVKHLVYASSSSVYGANTKMPFSVHDNVDHPLSLYAASKKANELMAHTYSHLYDIPTTGLRFFTVYGPWGRPDMAVFIFTKALLEGKTIELFNYGEMERDFTYVDDIVQGIVRLLPVIPQPDKQWSGAHPDPAYSFAPYRLYNIGNNHPVKLRYLIEVLERCTGKKANIILQPMQPGDVPATFADIDDLSRAVNFKPVTPIEEGVKKFVEWYREYYKL